MDYTLDTKESKDGLNRINSNGSLNDHKRIDANKNKKSHFRLPAISTNKNLTSIASYEIQPSKSPDNQMTSLQQSLFGGQS